MSTQYFSHEKHYVTLNNYLRSKYGTKVYRIALNAGFSCPNRDGKINTLGCTYCSNALSGDFAGAKSLSLIEQFNSIKEMMAHKWQNGKYIAYLQAGSNTYGDLQQIKKVYETVINLDDNIIILSIATRPDCLNDEILNLLVSLQKRITIWVELGFQTMHEKTYHAINRGYENEVFEKWVRKLKACNIPVIVHIINGLPNETKEMMIETAKYLNKFNIDGIKIHMLHVLKNTPMGESYLKEPFTLLSLPSFVDVTVQQLRNLSSNIVIHRLTGDGPLDLLIEPRWTIKKFVVLNEIDKYMRLNNYYQGDLNVSN